MTSSSLVICPECVKSVEVKYIGEHLAFVHKYTIEERRIILGFLAKDRATLTSVYPFKCDVCLESFQTKRELSSHQIGVHNPAEPSTENEFECAFAECEQSFATFEDFVSHCAINHSAGSHYRFEIINESFQDMRELLDWKADIEERTCTSFRIRRSNDRRTTEFECHRASSIIPSKSSTDTISPKIHCTAFMKCWIRKDGTVEVIACTEHLGHEKDPRKLLLSEKQKDELRELISEGLNAPEIFKKVRKRYGVMSRMHFVTDADLALLFDSKYIHEQVFGTQKMNYTCSECDEGPMPIQQLRKHIGEIHGRVAKLANAANSSGKHGTKWNDIYYSCKECQFLCFSQSVLYTHVKTYHPDFYADSYFNQCSTPSFVTCSECKMTFKTNYLLAVHSVNAHSNYVDRSLLVQTTFSNWEKFEPWLEQIESTTNTMLIKSAVQACGRKLVHSYNCYFSGIAKRSDVEENEGKVNDCSAFVTVIENEEGVLDCIGFFGHLGHHSDCGVSADVVKKGTEAETDEDEITSKVEGDEVQPCCLCGDITVPELDGMMIMESNWSCCNVEECKAVAHNLCIQLLGRTCMQCERGMLIGIGEAIPLTHAFDSSLITE